MFLEEAGDAVSCGKRAPSRSVKTTRPCPDCGDDFTALPLTRFCKKCSYKSTNRAQPGQRKWFRSVEKDKVITDRYDPHIKGRAAEIGRAIGWPAHVVIKRAAALGVASVGPANWNKIETDCVEECAGHRTPLWIVKRLKRMGYQRSLCAVVQKIKSLGISRAIKHGYSLNDIATCFGVHISTAEKWRAKGLLRATRSEGYTGPHQRWEITEEDVLSFVTEHPTAFGLRYVDQTWFLDLLTTHLRIRPQLVAVPRKKRRPGLGPAIDDEMEQLCRRA